MNGIKSSRTRVLFGLLMVVVFLFTIAGSAKAQDIPTDSSSIEVINPYFSIEHKTLEDGTQIQGYIINGPPDPLPEFEAERAASVMPLPSRGTIANFPSYSWVFGCSAVSGAMIAAYYDNHGYPNMYSGPTNGGVMPLTDTSWSNWSDGFVSYPNNPLIASHNGVDGRVTRGSIDDYWVSYGSSASDPYITGAWTQHTWSNAIGDYMKTSQSAYGSTDGSTWFYNWTSDSSKLDCTYMKDNTLPDGTLGRKNFYEARGYTVTDCYNQKTDNNSGGFTLANFQAEIDAGHPVLLNLQGHSIVGYGYSGNTIYIRDTWSSNQSFTPTMTWGGSYDGMALLSVSVVRLNPTVQYKSYLPFMINDSDVVIPPDSILNGDFESGQVNWTEYSLKGYDLIYHSDDLPPITLHSGEWAAWLGGDNAEISQLSQTVAVSAARGTLHYWYIIGSVDVCGWDYFSIHIDGIKRFEMDLCSDTGTDEWTEGTLDLSAWAGPSVTILFEVTTDSSGVSQLFLDDISLETSSRTAEGVYFSGVDAASQTRH